MILDIYNRVISHVVVLIWCYITFFRCFWDREQPLCRFGLTAVHMKEGSLRSSEGSFHSETASRAVLDVCCVTVPAMTA